MLGKMLSSRRFGTTLSSADGYVPDTLCPKEKGYGDYIVMDIDENGMIEDWDFDIDDFTKNELL